MKRLCASKNSRQRLESCPDNIVFRLLSRQRTPGSLCMKTHHPRACILRAILVFHPARVDAPGGTILCNLFEEIQMRVEEKRKPWRKLVNIHALSNSGFNISKTICECESKLLHRGRPCFTDMITAH